MMKKLVIVALFSAITGGIVTHALADKQPAMKKALNHLEQAHQSLKAATHDKGGHRAKAVEHVEAAIKEVKEGIEFDNKN